MILSASPFVNIFIGSSKSVMGRQSSRRGFPAVFRSGVIRPRARCGGMVLKSCIVWKRERRAFLMYGGAYLRNRAETPDIPAFEPFEELLLSSASSSLRVQSFITSDAQSSGIVSSSVSPAVPSIGTGLARRWACSASSCLGTCASGTVRTAGRFLWSVKRSTYGSVHFPVLRGLHGLKGNCSSVFGGFGEMSMQGHGCGCFSSVFVSFGWRGVEGGSCFDSLSSGVHISCGSRIEFNDMIFSPLLRKWMHFAIPSGHLLCWQCL